MQNAVTVDATLEAVVTDRLVVVAALTLVIG